MIAVMSLMVVMKYPLTFCMQVANAAAGIVVGYIGAACVTSNELRLELERFKEVGLLRNG